MWHVAASVIHIKGVRSLISYCWAFFCSVHSNVLVQYTVSILSLATEVMCIPASPGFWVIYPMILEKGLQMTLTVAYYDSLSV